MPDPCSRLEPDGPLALLDARTLFASGAVRRRSSGGLTRLPSGRLLFTFALGTAGEERHNDGAIMLSHSDDGGQTWDDPLPIYAYPGWDSFPMSGFCHLPNNRLRLFVGRVKLDFSLGGDEPFAGWYCGSIDSGDGGETWSEPGPDIRLFPTWTEFYGASNPYPVSGDGLLWAVIGTQGRDVDWQAGVTFTDLEGNDYSPPVIFAAAPGRNYSDTDLIRLADGRFLAVTREHVVKDSVFSHSADEGRTWTPIRPTGFKGANFKLFRLRSGLILCAYRDEDPARRGISVSTSADGGETWQFAGQLYAPDPNTAHRPGNLCGYPDLVALDDNEIACTLHTYPGHRGQIDLHFLRLRDQT
ncbi:MAG: hypothetical protein QOG89_1796 [Thermomicrobiales bacterium]|nr:hypothetical protein [Thermomicrobiales bacterium]